MATLRQTLRGLPKADEQLVRGPGGVLQKAPTLQEATATAGLSTAPTTPMAAQMVGASPQASKMAGTPQQMQATLQTALRQKQYGRETTAEEKAAMTKSEDMKKLGGLGERVTTLVQGEYNKLVPPTAPPTTTAGGVQPAPTQPTTSVPVGAANQELAKYSQQLATIRANPDSPEARTAMAEISTALGKDPKDIDFNALYQDAQTAIASAATKTIGDYKGVVKVPQILQQLGYDLPTLSDLIGVPADKLKDFSLEQLQDKVNEVTSREFTRTQQLEQQAMSPLVGVAERGLARAAARELSTTGVRATESDMQKLADQVTAATTVTFMGQTKPVDQWLADDEISAMIKEVVESPANSKLRRDLKAMAPQFYSFIEGNENALKEAAARIEIGTSKFKQIQEANKAELAKTKVSEDILEDLAPNATGLQTEDTTKPAEPVAPGQEPEVAKPKDPILQYLDTITDTEKVEANKILANIKALDPTTYEQLKTLTADEWKSLGMGKPDSNWSKLQAYNADLQYLKSIKDTDVDSLISQIFSDVGTLTMAQDTIARSNTLRALGLDSGVSLTSLDPKKLKEDLLAKRPPVSIKDAAGGKIPSTEKQKLGTLISPKPDSQEFLLYDKLRPVMKDGKLSAEEINAAEGPVSQLSWDQLLKLQDMSKSPKAAIDRSTLDSKLNIMKDNNTSSLLKFRGVVPANSTRMATIDAYASLLDQDPRKVDHARVKKDLSSQLTAAFNDPKRSDVDFDKTIDRAKSLGVLTPDLINAINESARRRYQSRIFSGATQTNAKARQSTIETNLGLWSNGVQNGLYPYAWGIDANGNPRKSAADFNIPKVTLKKASKTVTVSPEYAGRYELEGWKRV